MKIVFIDKDNNSIHAFTDWVIDFENVEYHFFKDDEKKILDYITENNVNGVVIDVDTPYESAGKDLAVKIAKISPNVKFLFISLNDLKKEDLPSLVKNKTIGILFKPLTKEILNYLVKINLKTSILKVEMFGHFDCFINEKLVHFSSKKSKELFALVLAQNGKSLTMDHAITSLWPDKAMNKSKILYRDAVWRLRKTLKEINFNCVEFARGLLMLDKSNIDCDYYHYLNNKKVSHHDFDDFLIEYEWSMDNSYNK